MDWMGTLQKMGGAPSAPTPGMGAGNQPFAAGLMSGQNPQMPTGQDIPGMVSQPAPQGPGQPGRPPGPGGPQAMGQPDPMMYARVIESLVQMFMGRADASEQARQQGIPVRRPMRGY